MTDFEKFINFLNAMNFKYEIEEYSDIKTILISKEHIYQSYNNRIEINFDKSKNNKFIEFVAWGE